MAASSQHPSRKPAPRGGADGLFYVYRTPHGPLTIRSEGNAITDIALGEVALPGTRKPSAAANEAATQILEYLAGKRRSFDLELAPTGSAFQKLVWNALREIPYGESLTCADMARTLGRPGAHRSVGSAVRSNPLAIVVPAHRVVGANGTPLGSGRTADVKQALLRMERDLAFRG